MTTHDLLKPAQRPGAFIALVICLALMWGAVIIASRVQRDSGKVEVSDVWFANYNSIPVRAKLFRPVQAAPQQRVPGVVYIHGYQNNRETGDAYCIEIARRGIAALSIDAIGRGHSGVPGDAGDADFDPVYGGTSALEFLRSLDFVDPASTGMVGHSLGAEMAYNVALGDRDLRATVITGYAYTASATREMPRNMLMIIGKYDEFRKRMTGVGDIGKDWMSTEQTKAAFPAGSPRIGVTYGDFAKGTARRVFIPPITHVHESHSEAAIAETVEWLALSLRPAESGLTPSDQTWKIKEYATLIAMLAAFASLIPLALILMRLPFFNALRSTASPSFACGTGDYLKSVSINGALMWLYLPLILVLFGFHKYVVPIQSVFPMMMVNAIVWWLLWVNFIGLFIIRGWYRKGRTSGILAPADTGLSWEGGAMKPDRRGVAAAVVLGAVLFIFMYLNETLAEKLYIINYRFVWPFMSDLTAYRVGMFFLYLPFILFCFLVTGVFLHGRIRTAAKGTWAKTFVRWSLYSAAALCVPLILFLLVQYAPLFTAGIIPFSGPGGLFSVFVIGLFPIIALLAVTSVLSAWLYQLTGTVYAGAVLNALIVAWSLASSQVIAPIPV